MERGWKDINWDNKPGQKIPQDTECYIKKLWLFTKKYKENIFKPVDRFALSSGHTS